jgi:hypothetical protein
MGRLNRTRPNRLAPALLTRISTLPWRSSACVKSANQPTPSTTPSSPHPFDLPLNQPIPTYSSLMMLDSR